ncbi:hypothetical protein M1L60_06385 [Actinoplanes sp. TRM 88003]|uniref:Uncharacterized protein n=1 Tax=Paractinoplanes aksuensis TaxID=2939490 RepID=A0ABT1DJI7_9ACTN|nr:hypothetical protein [Actinoplanes aksuensis]MCO8270220.1 hypothetical protein [Actinoplanes aksuensis]
MIRQIRPSLDGAQAHPAPAKIGAPILAAWNAKEDLLDLLAIARTRELVHRLLRRFHTRCAGSDLHLSPAQIRRAVIPATPNALTSARSARRMRAVARVGHRFSSRLESDGSAGFATGAQGPSIVKGPPSTP